MYRPLFSGCHHNASTASDFQEELSKGDSRTSSAKRMIFVKGNGQDSSRNADDMREKDRMRKRDPTISFIAQCSTRQDLQHGNGDPDDQVIYDYGSRAPPLHFPATAQPSS